jgi:hypothetical protein
MPIRDDDIFQDSDISDPLSIERSAPVDDQEATVIETLCLASTPGPLMTDDATEGQGVVVATLPDGRHIVSLSCEVSVTEAETMTEANVQLLCRARHLILRLLRDRRRLLDRIRELEGADQQPATPTHPR